MPKLLLVCFFDPLGIATVKEHVLQWQAYSRFKIDILNLWPGGARHLRIPIGVDLNRYAGVIIHNTASYSPKNLWSLDSDLPEKFDHYKGVLVLAKQDENYYTEEYARFIEQKNVRVLASCVPPSEIDKAYPGLRARGTTVVHTLTGYVSDPLQRQAEQASGYRHTDVGYRGSIQPLSFGRLGYEKRKIGEDFAGVCRRHGLSCDISSRWEDRFSGLEWFKFLGSIRAVLGTESGSNVFDFDGTVSRLCAEFVERNSELDASSEAYFEKAYAEVLQEFEGNVKYAQVSPRHFEAAATRTLQVLYEGTYSGIFQPWRHFLPLAKDLSNEDEVVDAIRDDAVVSRITAAAYDEVILDPAYHYRTFVARVDDAIEAALPSSYLPATPGTDSTPAGREEGAKAPAAPARRKALILVGHEPTLDPRIEWLAGALSEKFDVCEIGTHRTHEPQKPTLEQVSGSRWRMRVARDMHDGSFGPLVDQLELSLPPEIAGLLTLRFLSEAPKDAALEAAGGMGDERIPGFQALCRYMYDTNMALWQAARLTGGADIIISCDLDSLPAGVAAGAGLRSPVVYDAHEFWPFSFPGMSAWECQFWSAVEKRYAALASHRVTVSPPLAATMSHYYGLHFNAVPNAVPLAEGVGTRATRAARSPNAVVFLFQGGFAVQRGLEELVDAWPRTDQNCILQLRGPDNDFKRSIIARAQHTGLVGERIFFPEPVGETDLVAASAEADVGLIPYHAFLAGYKYACPNKLSQYMAAGLPILSNQLVYVSQILNDAQCGESVSFLDQDALVRAVNTLANDSGRRLRYAANARCWFEDEFHWEKQSSALIQSVHDLAFRSDRPRGKFGFDWIAQNDGLGPGALAKLQKVFREKRHTAELYSAEARHRFLDLRELRLNVRSGVQLISETYSGERKRLATVVQGEDNLPETLESATLLDIVSRVEQDQDAIAAALVAWASLPSEARQQEDISSSERVIELHKAQIERLADLLSELGLAWQEWQHEAARMLADLGKRIEAAAQRNLVVLYAGEVRRLAKAYDDLTASYLAEAERLARVYRDEHMRLFGRTSAAAQELDTAPLIEAIGAKADGGPDLVELSRADAVGEANPEECSAESAAALAARLQQKAVDLTDSIGRLDAEYKSWIDAANRAISSLAEMQPTDMLARQ